MIFENTNNWREWSKADKLKLYKHCKESYAAGNSPLEDFEFDEEFYKSQMEMIC